MAPHDLRERFTALIRREAVRGVFTLTEATLTEATLAAGLWRTGRYAVINGVFSAPLAAVAVASAAGAGIAAVTGS